MGKRTLATIRRIAAKTPITLAETDELAANIEQVTIEGWRLIAMKNEFQIGDLCVYLELDSLLPAEAAWVQGHAPFMEQSKWRVKIKKLSKFRVMVDDAPRIVISQGLALPISILPQDCPVVEHADVTDALGVQKYEAPVSFDADDICGEFPIWISTTDEPRIQSVIRALDELRGKPYVITQKLEGSSLTAWIDEDALHLASRYNERARGNNIYWRAAEAVGLEAKLRRFPNLAVQAEVVGEGIHKNRLGLKGITLSIFNVFDRQRGLYLDDAALRQFCAEADLPTAPVIEMGDAFAYSLNELEERAKGLYAGTTTPQEGIVIRPQHEMVSMAIGGRLSFKCLNTDYLLKFES
jgi:RNA ligase (TIGR02306 family)